MNPKTIHIADYSYDLPDERIAKFPLPERDASKLLIYQHGQVTEDVFRSLPKYLPSGALMVFNNTKVIQARLHFRKKAQPLSTVNSNNGEENHVGASSLTNTSDGLPIMGEMSAGQRGSVLGALIEVFCLEPALPNDYQLNFSQKGCVQWYCLVGNLKKWKEGKLFREIAMPDGTTLTLACERKGLHGTSHIVEFSWNGDYTWAELLDAVGELPIPPYLNRATQESDKTTYQTVYSKIKGSVAAPTAGLHFTERVLKALDEAGIDREELTLHVGAGTFKPVKSEEIGGHDMHTEHIAVRRQTIEKLIAHGGEAIAVGTTSVRTLESLYYMGILAQQGEEDLHVPQWMPYEVTNSHSSTLDSLQSLLAYMDKHQMEVLHSSTQIIIAPGYDYHIVKRMVTNFHQPQSTLLLLVSAFLKGDWRKVYDYAFSHDFRFLSYGDSSLLIP